jgi:regulator of sigma E protease
LTPRADAPNGEGPLGVSLAETAIVKYPFFQSLGNGIIRTFDLIQVFLLALWGIIAGLFAGKGAPADLAGPVGIAILTKSVADLGLVYVLQFAALLSINLGIINALPIPALDGGRILFIVIEKMRGYPVSQRTEQKFHSIFFALLILLMVLVTYKDIAKLIK